MQLKASAVYRMGIQIFRLFSTFTPIISWSTPLDVGGNVYFKNLISLPHLDFLFLPLLFFNRSFYLSQTTRIFESISILNIGINNSAHPGCLWVKSSLKPQQKKVHLGAWIFKVFPFRFRMLLQFPSKIPTLDCGAGGPPSSHFPTWKSRSLSLHLENRRSNGGHFGDIQMMTSMTQLWNVTLPFSANGIPIGKEWGKGVKL